MVYRQYGWSCCNVLDLVALGSVRWELTQRLEPRVGVADTAGRHGWSWAKGVGLACRVELRVNGVQNGQSNLSCLPPKEFILRLKCRLTKLLVHPLEATISWWVQIFSCLPREYSSTTVVCPPYLTPVLVSCLSLGEGERLHSRESCRP
jgi:hypothetical protein